MKGWIIDAQLSDDGTGMDVWMYVANTGVRHLVIPWSASIHVYATKERLNNLANWLDFAEIRQRFGVGAMRFVRSRLSLDQYEMHDVLEIDMTDSRLMRRFAEHIES